MKKCLFFINDSKEDAVDVFNKAKEFLTSEGCKYELYDEKCNIKGNFDFALSIGGDGTFLRAALACSKVGIPIAGINLGRVGFLTAISPCEIRQKLKFIIDGEYSIENRMMIDVYGENGEFSISALNDVAIKNLFGNGVGSFMVYVNDEILYHYHADGILISTPTGSTAYSLSVGGPIVSPKSELMILSPIAPHSLKARSVVLNSEDVIKVEFDKESSFVGIDGQDIGLCENKLIIRRSKVKCKVIKFKDDNFYKNVFEKIK